MLAPQCYSNVLFYADGCDSNNNGVVIGAVVGVDCVVIIIMVITNIMVWIYCFRKRHHTGIATTYVTRFAKCALFAQLQIFRNTILKY